MAKLDNATLDPLVTALSFLRRIYTASDVDDYGDVVIGAKAYPDFFKDIHAEIGKLERVIASSLQER